jgi:hypothetical protein
MYVNPQCGCCPGHANYLRANGFKITVKETHDPTNSEAEGTGLGLSIARSLVRGVGGEIALASPAQGGLLVSVVLPPIPTHGQQRWATAQPAKIGGVWQAHVDP